MQFLEKDFPTHNDVYGKLFFRLRNVLDQFQLHLSGQGMTFVVRQYDFKSLNRYRLSDFDIGPFDRVVVSSRPTSGGCILTVTRLVRAYMNNIPNSRW